MRKILIFGNSGSGKSTLAKHLSTSEALAHLDLDTVAWTESAIPERKPIAVSGEAILAFINSGQGWVIEGCYADLLSLAVPYANEIIFLDLPISVCIDNARNRPWEQHKYESLEAQNANLEMLIDWIAAYPMREGELSRAAHVELYEHFAGTKQRLRENTDL